MLLYVVHGNTCFNSYGYKERIFGVYTKKDTAKIARDLVVKELFAEEIKRGSFSDVHIITEVDDEIEILEIESDMAVNIELGGYEE